MTDDEVLQLLAIPMWIEAAIARRDGVVRSSDELDLAMRGGLGFDSKQSWMAFFDQLGSQRMLAAIDRWSERTPAISAPPELIRQLKQLPPGEALEAFATEVS